MAYSAVVLLAKDGEKGAPKSNFERQMASSLNIESEFQR